jgi:hypothetical protein|nr:MAG TPA: hypothetical protein [Bacteriophage sp.]
MKVENLLDHPIDLTTIEGCKSFSEWVNGDISNAFYLGFLREDFSEYVPKMNECEEGIQFLKSIATANNNAKKYLKELARLMDPYLQSAEGFVILDMVNDVLKNISLEEKNDIYDVAYVLGIYINYLYTTQNEA